MKQHGPLIPTTSNRLSCLPCMPTFRRRRTRASVTTISAVYHQHPGAFKGRDAAASITSPPKQRHRTSKGGIKGSLSRIFKRKQTSTPPAPLLLPPPPPPPLATQPPRSASAHNTVKSSTPPATVSIASRTLHSIQPAPPTASDDDIRFDSGKGSVDPEPYSMYNTFGSLEEPEETMGVSAASTESSDASKGSADDQHPKNDAEADAGQHPHSVSTIVDPDDAPAQPEQQQTTEDMAPSTPSPEESYNAQEAAQHLWDEDEAIVPKEQAAEWLGRRALFNQDALCFYMDKFDFVNMRLDEAISKLYLKAETQQVDRILQVFANRYWDCNQGCVLQNADAIYAVAYSLVLLNTDLHVAQGSYNRMTRHEFVRNTMDAIYDHEAAPASLVREAQTEVYLKQLYVSVKQSQIMQPRRQASLQSVERVYANNRAIRSMRSLGSIIRSTRREAMAASKPVGHGSDPLSSAMSCATSSAPASPSQSTFSFKDITGQVSLISDPPYTKEGLVRRKHLFESSDRRARNREWRRCLLVVADGELKVYQLQASSGELQCKGVQRENSINTVSIPPQSTTEENEDKGWDSCFRLLGCFPLNHTLTHVLPSPGYDRRRTHVFAVQFPDGGVYLFQASSRVQCREWAATCNYWAARKSKQPLAGGICSIEYGWGACLDETSACTPDPDSIVLCEWHPPGSPLISSALDEQQQHLAMMRHLRSLDQELDIHNQVKGKMLRKFPSRCDNHARAMYNWETKSKYLLHDMVKYQNYCAALEKGIKHRAAAAAAAAAAPAGGGPLPCGTPTDTDHQPAAP